jgi:hypothetical protein
VGRRIKIPTIYDKEHEVLQLEMDSRLAKVLDLYSRGMKQVEIAEHLGFSQSLVSKDLGRIKTRVKRRIGKMMEDEVWTYGRYLAGSEAALKKLWENSQGRAGSSQEKDTGACADNGILRQGEQGSAACLEGGKTGRGMKCEFRGNLISICRYRQ